jgi:hypothetical protein
MDPAATTRATVYLDADLHQALRLKAASTRRSISEVVAAAADKRCTAYGKAPIASPMPSMTLARSSKSSGSVIEARFIERAEPPPLRSDARLIEAAANRDQKNFG